jgi:hypothetical protein
MSNSHISTPETITVNGKEYTLSAIDLKEIVALERALQRQPLDELAQVFIANPDLSIEDKEIMEAGARKAGKGIRVGTKEFDEAVVSFSGMMTLLWFSLRKVHKDITRDEAEGVITKDNMADVTERLHRVTGFKDDSKKA